MILPTKLSPAMPLTVTGLLLIYFVMFGGDIPMVFTNPEDARKYRFFMIMCFLLGVILLFTPVWMT